MTLPLHTVLDMFATRRRLAQLAAAPESYFSEYKKHPKEKRYIAAIRRAATGLRRDLEHETKTCADKATISLYNSAIRCINARLKDLPK